MPYIQPDFRLLLRWLRRLLFAWLFTLVYAPIALSGSGPVNAVLDCGLILVFPLWCFLVVRAAIQLVPRRRNFFWVFPALFLLLAVIECSVLFVIILLPRHPLPHHFLADALFGITFNSLLFAFIITGVWLILPRPTAPNFYHCAKCNYQLQGSLHSNQCPECGHFLLIGEDYPYLPQHLAALENLSTPEEVPDPEPPEEQR